MSSTTNQNNGYNNNQLVSSDCSNITPDVNLVWKISKNGVLCNNNKNKIDENLSSTIKIDISLSEIPSTDQVVVDNSIEANSGVADESIPESVLQYERHLRKAQHAKKVGQDISTDTLEVVYVDEYIVVINKPSGVLTVPGINCNPSVLDLVYKQFFINSKCGNNNNEQKNNNGDTTTESSASHTMIVHRLDMDTSGLVIFGRSPDVTKKLHVQFRDRNVHKEYECLVMGHFPPSEITSNIMNIDNNDNDSINSNIDLSNISITVNLPLQRDHEHPPFMRVSTPKSEQAAIDAVQALQKHGWKKLVRKKPKPSMTSIHIIEQGEYNNNNNNNRQKDETMTTNSVLPLPYTRLRLIPITGRTHQLRVHLAALGYPICGDPTYSLYGEAAPVGGLQSIQSLLFYCDDNNDFHDDNNNNNKTDIQQKLVRSTLNVGCCPLEYQKNWMNEYPPNVKPMCLHAAKLVLDHPITGKPLVLESSPPF